MTIQNNIASYDDVTVWTALITPLLDNGAIDFQSLASIAKSQNDAGNGILLLGSTGEGLALSLPEQMSIVQFICDLSLTSPLMVAVGGVDLSSQLAWVNTCNSLPIHAYLLGSPIYAKPGPIGQFQWFSALLEQADFPCMIYNVPSRSGVSLSLSALEKLQQYANFWALKEASGDLQQFLSYRQSCPNIALFSGEDAMMPYLASANAKGLVSVCANVWPIATHRYVDMALNGETQSLFPIWQNAVDSLFEVSSPVPVKVLMHELAQIQSPYLRPPLTSKELTSTESIRNADIAVSHWLSQNTLSA